MQRLFVIGLIMMCGTSVANEPMWPYINGGNGLERTEPVFEGLVVPPTVLPRWHSVKYPNGVPHCGELSTTSGWPTCTNPPQGGWTTGGPTTVTGDGRLSYSSAGRFVLNDQDSLDQSDSKYADPTGYWMNNWLDSNKSLRPTFAAPNSTKNWNLSSITLIHTGASLNHPTIMNRGAENASNPWVTDSSCRDESDTNHGTLDRLCYRLRISGWGQPSAGTNHQGATPPNVILEKPYVVFADVDVVVDAAFTSIDSVELVGTPSILTTERPDSGPYQDPVADGLHWRQSPNQQKDTWIPFGFEPGASINGEIIVYRTNEETTTWVAIHRDLIENISNPDTTACPLSTLDLSFESNAQYWGPIELSRLHRLRECKVGFNTATSKNILFKDVVPLSHYPLRYPDGTQLVAGDDLFIGYNWVSKDAADIFGFLQEGGPTTNLPANSTARRSGAFMAGVSTRGQIQRLDKGAFNLRNVGYENGEAFASAGKRYGRWSGDQPLRSGMDNGYLFFNRRHMSVHEITFDEQGANCIIGMPMTHLMMPDGTPGYSSTMHTPEMWHATSNSAPDPEGFVSHLTRTVDHCSGREPDDDWIFVGRLSIAKAWMSAEYDNSTLRFPTSASNYFDYLASAGPTTEGFVGSAVYLQKDASITIEDSSRVFDGGAIDANGEIDDQFSLTFAIKTLPELQTALDNNEFVNVVEQRGLMKVRTFKNGSEYRMQVLLDTETNPIPGFYDTWFAQPYTFRPGSWLHVAVRVKEGVLGEVCVVEYDGGDQPNAVAHHCTTKDLTGQELENYPQGATGIRDVILGPNAGAGDYVMALDEFYLYNAWLPNEKLATLMYLRNDMDFRGAYTVLPQAPAIDAYGNIGIQGIVPSNFPAHEHDMSDQHIRVPASFTSANGNLIYDAGVWSGLRTLGDQLFESADLSSDGSGSNTGFSCASCHIDDSANQTAHSGTALDSLPNSGTATRNTPMLKTSLGGTHKGLDGNASSTLAFVLSPIEGEMGGVLSDVCEALRGSRKWPARFNPVFGAGALQASTPCAEVEAMTAKALTAYSFDLSWDTPITSPGSYGTSEKLGRDLFFGKAMCASCHTPPLFTDNSFRNTGVGLTSPWLDKVEDRYLDVGRYGVTGLLEDVGKFKVPSLLYVAKTAPYMHDGSFATLNDVVRHYVNGGSTHLNNIDQIEMSGIDLSETEINALVDFLNTLD